MAKGDFRPAIMAIVLVLFGSACAEDPPAPGASSSRMTTGKVADPQSGPSEAAPKADSTGSPVAGWNAHPTAQTRKDNKREIERPKAPPLSKSEQERYDRVARNLVEAINRHDQKTYRALHTDEAWASAIDWWQDMFAAQVLRFGSIQRAYQPQRGIIRIGTMGMGGDARNGASFVAIFEKKVGGIFSFELNDEDKIVHTSVFIKEELGDYNGWEAKLIFEKKN